MAELTTAETPADPCCASEQQVTCCEPSTKSRLLVVWAGFR
jgi:hypothetical protein